MTTTRKQTSTKAILLAFLVLFGMIISPVCATTEIVTTGYFPEAVLEFSSENMYNLTYTANSSYAIADIQFRAPKGTQLNYTITYGVGNSLSGYAEYLAINPSYFNLYSDGITTINIGSSTDSRTYIDTGLFRKWEIVGYAREQDDNETVISNGFAIYDVSLGIGNIGLQSGFIAYEPVTNIQPIESITFASNMPVLVEIFVSDRQEIESGITKTYAEAVNEWYNLALQIGITIFGLAYQLFYWAKFFFWDNLLMTICIYIGVTGAIAFNKSKNIFQAIQKFFNYQKSLYRFILEMWMWLINIVATFLSIFRI